VKLWDPATGKVRASLARHTAMVYAMAFSPDGEYLVSGSTDKSVYVWRVRDGALVRTHTAPSGVYDVAFNAEGDKVAACCANSAVSVLDLRM
jgi:transducin (beta)-like 1